MSDKVTLCTRPDPTLCAVLRALGIGYTSLVSSNGDGDWVQLEWDAERDQRLLDLLEHLADLRLAYVDYRQRHYQLTLPGLEGTS